MSVVVNPRDRTSTIRCDTCGILAPIMTAAGIDPVALLGERVQGWQADAGGQKCAKCRAVAS